MCLSELDEKVKDVTEGWKIFSRDMRPRYFDDRIRERYGVPGIVSPEAFVDPFPTNEWIKDPQDVMLKDSRGNEYQTGFHFYLKKGEAVDLAHPTGEMLRKVKVKEVVATGSSGMFAKNGPVLAGVAREIYVIDE